jgi:hypothetical protein
MAIGAVWDWRSEHNKQGEECQILTAVSVKTESFCKETESDQKSTKSVLSLTYLDAEA